MNEKIDKVINNLKVNTAFNGKHRKCTLKDRMKEFNTPGLCITVINDGKIETTKCLGLKEYGSKNRITKNTMFLAGSISKPIFALIVMKLKEKGLLDLDVDINKYLKRWKVPKNGKWQPKVTLRQILSHTAGFTVHGFRGYAKSEEMPTIIQILNGETPANSPAILVDIMPVTQFRYAGGGTTVAQLAIEDLIGKSLPEIAYDELIKPLGLKNSTFDQVLPDRMFEQAATGHTFFKSATIGKHHLYPEMAAAGFWSTSEDLAKITIELQKAIKGDSNFIQRETILEMLEPNKIAPNMGIAFRLDGEKNSKRFSHSGWDEGFLAHLCSYQNDSKGLIIMINSNQGFPLINEITDSIAREYKWKDYLPEKRKKLAISKTLLKKYVGSYNTDKDKIIKVTAKGDDLFLQYDDQSPMQLNSASKTDFYLTYLNSDVTFEFSSKNKITKLTLIQEENKIEAEKN